MKQLECCGGEKTMVSRARRTGAQIKGKRLTNAVPGMLFPFVGDNARK